VTKKHKPKSREKIFRIDYEVTKFETVYVKAFDEISAVEMTRIHKMDNFKMWSTDIVRKKDIPKNEELIGDDLDD